MKCDLSTLECKYSPSLPLLKCPSVSRADAAKQKLIVPEKGPVMLLYELFSDIQFECMQTDGGQFSRFKMRVKVNEEVFEGTGNLRKRITNK